MHVLRYYRAVKDSLSTGFSNHHLDNIYLIDALERRYGLALVFVQCIVYDVSVPDLDVGFRRVALERERVLHPVFVVSLSFSISNRDNATSAYDTLLTSG